jgi:hypothetical protein
MAQRQRVSDGAGFRDGGDNRDFAPACVPANGAKRVGQDANSLGPVTVIIGNENAHRDC